MILKKTFQKLEKILIPLLSLQPPYLHGCFFQIHQRNFFAIKCFKPLKVRYHTFFGIVWSKVQHNLLRRKWRAVFLIYGFHFIRCENSFDKFFLLKFVIKEIKYPFLLLFHCFIVAQLFFIVLQLVFYLFYLCVNLEVVQEKINSINLSNPPIDFKIFDFFFFL